MNASPTEWRDSNLLPDIWEIDERNHWKILLWDEYAAQILNQGALNGN